jgi:hypothetical protein
MDNHRLFGCKKTGTGTQSGFCPAPAARFFISGYLLTVNSNHTRNLAKLNHRIPCKKSDFVIQ